MSSKSFPRLSLLALLVLVSILAFQPQVRGLSDSYPPTGYNLLGATAYVSGALTDLHSDDDVYMVFRSYVSQISAQTFYAHQETITIGGLDYYRLRLESGDATGTSLSASMASTGRQLLGKFVCPLTGVTSIPASMWRVYYRMWHSSVPEEVLTNSPSSNPAGTWSNKPYAFSSDDNYAYTDIEEATQQYGNYGFSVPPAANVTKVEVGYEAYGGGPGDDKIGITLSWDNGITLATEYISPSLGDTDPDIVNWLDFTNATNWTTDKLSNVNFRTRVKAIRGNGAKLDNVFLDWFPVRVTYVVPPLAHADVDILIRGADGTIRQTVAGDAANSETLSTVAQTLSETYSWPTNTAVNETDYLEIDYYLHVTTANPAVTAYMTIDNNSLTTTDQTRITGIFPSEYTVEIEFTGSSNTNYWSQVIWTINSAWTTGNVSVTLQLYNYVLGAYPTSGSGYITYTSSAIPNTDETKSQTITTNLRNFRDALGNWKMKIKGVKSTTSQFDFKADLIRYETTSVAPPDVAVLNVTGCPTNVYPGEIVEINVTVKNEGGITETFNVTLYYDTTQIGKQTVLSLAPSANTTVTFNWNTTGVPPDTYTIKAVADTVPDETDTADNTLIDGAINVLMFYVHDVAVVSVAPSDTEVEVGQVLNVSVVVRNNGNITETFNVTLYYDSHAIGTQTVTDLEPGTETTLNFSWDTTDVTPGDDYSIRAETSGVTGETDTTDNAYTYGTVKVKSQTTPSLPDWRPILPYLIPLLLGGLGFLVAGVLRKKRETGQGFEFFNELTDGGIPDAYSVIIIGGVGSGKSVLCQQLAYEYLTQGKSCVYVTYDIFPFEVGQNMKNFGWDISMYEKEGRFKFVDCYSSTAGLESEEKHHVEQPFALSDLGIVMSTAMEEVKHKSTKVFLDSTASLFARLDASKVTEFLQDRSARIKGDKGVFFFSVGKRTVPSGPMQRLEEIVDCIIELDVYEEKKKTWKRMRIRKLRGRRVTDIWIPFKIETKKGITFLPPKGWSEKRRS